MRWDAHQEVINFAAVESMRSGLTSIEAPIRQQLLNKLTFFARVDLTIWRARQEVNKTRGKVMRIS